MCVTLYLLYKSRHHKSRSKHNVVPFIYSLLDNMYKTILNKVKFIIIEIINPINRNLKHSIINITSNLRFGIVIKGSTHICFFYLISYEKYITTFFVGIQENLFDISRHSCHNVSFLFYFY